MHNALAGLECRHDEGGTRLTVELFLGSHDLLFYGTYHVGRLGLRDTDDIRASSYDAADILLPEVGIEAVDTNDTLRSTVVDGGQCMVE